MNAQTLTLADLCARCADEHAAFHAGRASDSAYCYELFRRAIAERDGHAWDFLYSQYYEQVSRWVRAHSVFRRVDESDDYFANAVLAKFWQVMTPDRWDGFESLGHLLSYMKNCVNSVLLDYVRAAKRHELNDSLETLFESEQPTGFSAETIAQRHIDARSLWQTVTQNLNDDTERIVAHGLFVLGLSSAQIYERHGDRFDAINDIYRAAERIRRRLRRNAALRDLFESYQ